MDKKLQTVLHFLTNEDDVNFARLQWIMGNYSVQLFWPSQLKIEIFSLAFYR